MKKGKNTSFWMAAALAFVFTSRVQAQQSIADSTILLTMLQVSYGAYLPQGDLGKRFGFSNLLGAEIGPKFRSNWYVIGGGHFLFGDVVRENTLFTQTAFNLVIVDPQTGQSSAYSGWLDRDGRDFVPTLNLRGFTASIRAGRIVHELRFRGLNPNCGPFVEAGVQAIQHRIAISSPDNAPYLYGDYRKGYDRLTRGIGALFSVGYRIFSNSRYINGFIAVDYQHHWTQNLRYNFDQRRRDDRIRDDILVGLRVGWCFPIYQQAPEGYYYY